MKNKLDTIKPIFEFEIKKKLDGVIIYLSKSASVTDFDLYIKHIEKSFCDFNSFMINCLADLMVSQNINPNEEMKTDNVVGKETTTFQIFHLQLVDSFSNMQNQFIEKILLHHKDSKNHYEQLHQVLHNCLTKF